MGLRSSQELHSRGIVQLGQDTFDDARVRGLFSSERYAEARDLSLELLARKERLGRAHPSWQQSAETLLEIYYVTGEYEKAARLLTEALRFADETSQVYFTRLSKLAGLYEKMGAYEAAEPLYLQVLSLRKSALGEEHPDVMSSLSYLAALYRKLGAFEKAEKHLEAAKVILDRCRSAASAHGRKPDYENWLVSMGMLQHAMRKYEVAEPLLKEALLHQEPRQHLGERPKRFYATTVSLYASTCSALGRHQQAEQYFQLALDLRRAMLGEHPHVAASLHDLGLHRMSSGDLDGAQQAFSESAQIRKQTLGPCHPLYAESLAALAECFCFQAYRSSDFAGYEKALELLVQVGHIRLKTISKILSTLSDSRRFAYLRTIENTGTFD